MNPDYGTYADYGNYGAQHVRPETTGAALFFIGGLFLFFLVIAILCYVYTAVCLMKIAKKTNTENAWLAWIPIANIILMLQVAKKPLWWIILFFIPIVNLVMGVLVWMEIAKRLGKPDWIGILYIIPLVNLIALGYLAFSHSDSVPPVNPTPPAQPAA